MGTGPVCFTSIRGTTGFWPPTPAVNTATVLPEARLGSLGRQHTRRRLRYPDHRCVLRESQSGEPFDRKIVGLRELNGLGSASPKFIMGSSDEQKFDHPTQKPCELMRRPILNHTKRGELVYEPFM
jgi:hypothetical protein